MSEATVKTKRKRREKGFTQIDNKALRDKRLSLAVRGFFALMYSLSEDEEHPISYYLKVGGISRETFYNYVKSLEKLGYLAREQTHQDGGKFGVNVYTLDDRPSTTFPNTAQPDTAQPDTAQPDTENHDADKYSKGKNKPPIVPQGDGADGFELFWAYYRDTVCAMDHNRAGNKGKARKAWDKLGPDRALLDRIAAYLMAQIKTDEWRRGIGIPHASSFLNAIGRGEYDLTPAETPRIAPQRPPDEPQREEDMPL